MTDRRSAPPADPAGPSPAVTSGRAAPAGRVIERGRAKAHRPLPPEVREAAVARGLAAYGRGDWYLAHEELEPAWMGTDDPAERALLSGLIKVAAAYVHAARGNPLGVRTNLRGARERLVTAAAATATGPAPAAAIAASRSAAAAAAIDLSALVRAVDDRLARVEALCDQPDDGAIGERNARAAVPAHAVAGPVGRLRRPPVAIPLIPLPRLAR